MKDIKDIKGVNQQLAPPPISTAEPESKHPGKHG